MENFLDSVLPVLIIAAVIIFRVVSAVRGVRRNPRANKGAPVKAAPPKAARGFVPWEDALSDDSSPGDTGRNGDAGNDGPAQTAPAGDDEAFSAWNLSVDDDLPAPASRPPEIPPSPAPPTAPSPGPAPVGFSRFPEAPDRFAAASGGLSRFAETPGPLAALARSAPARSKRRGLSPLQQGVVWAEILGAPKGLEG
jgi:hypothetical protein